MKFRDPITAVIYGLLIALTLALTGCESDGKSAPGKAEDSAVGVSDALARADVRTGEIEQQARKLPSLPPKDEILRHADGIHNDLQQGGELLSAARASLADMTNTLNERDTRIAVMQAEIDRLNQAWIGPRAWRWFGWGVVIFIAAGALSVGTGIVSAGGWGLFISRAINANVMLPFVLLRDLFLRFRGLKIGAVPVGPK